MNKNNIWKIILSSLLIFLPIPVLLLVDKFGDTIIPVMVGGYSIMSAVMLVVHLGSLLVGLKSLKGYEQNPKIVNIFFWLIPALNVYVAAIFVALSYDHTLGESIIKYIVGLMFGILFILLGNYMPKARQNRFYGIKVKWALENETNWNATHRFGGKLMVIAGVVCVVSAFLPMNWFFAVFLVNLLAACLASVLYSYLYYRKQLRSGNYTKDESKVSSNDKKTLVILIVMLPIIFAIVGAIMFTGKLTFTINEESVLIESSFVGSSEIKYSDITSIEYRENVVDGSRVNGVGSAKLLCGWFRNSEFGNYMRYTYTDSKTCIVIVAGGEEYVIADVGAENTRALYEEILLRLEK